ncbi:DUF58 domain-containing protein [Ktedonospora formicarum]|uniref:DUF58 domain-containing protein n=1 Tax=Ktedonospora formicarum TaxID=2778364 RepID=A0A8J3HXP2_9CHLR|nr:DUF58 domain-containing protein [Ktedonospora formicarum]GHO42990.1 hypothetical protein KSX_11530 [Ktedonospora formicarum]
MLRPWQALLLLAVLAFFAVSSGWHDLYVLTYVLLVLFTLSWLWARYSVRKLIFRRSSTGGRVQVGEVFEERLMLDNLGVLPKLWVQIVDGSTLPGHRAGYVASMGGRKRAMWRVRTPCRQRGRFQLGPVSAISGDPFGLFRRRLTLSASNELLVLPRVLPITQFALFSGGLPGRGKTSRRALQTTTNATSIREYIAGDALSRIHWRSSARHNKLMVKEFDLDPAVDVWIFVDLNESVQAGEDEDSTEEYAVTIAATIAVHLLRQDLSVGMIVNGERREILTMDRGDRQIERVLELLAVVRSGPGPDLKEALALDAFHLGRNMAAIVITPSNSRDWHAGAQQLQRRGVQVAVIGLDAASFEEGLLSDEDSLALLEGAGIPVLHVRSQDPLTPILESGPEARYAQRR